MSWTPVCSLAQVPVGRGVCVLVQGEQVALVRTSDDDLYAVGNLDPISQAMVMSRGIVGSRGDVDVLISPLLKAAYDLASGRCLDADDTWLPVYDVRVADGQVEVDLAVQARQLA